MADHNGAPMALRGPRKGMKVVSPCATVVALFATFIQRRDRKGAPMARRGPRKRMKIAAALQRWDEKAGA